MQSTNFFLPFIFNGFGSNTESVTNFSEDEAAQSEQLPQVIEYPKSSHSLIHICDVNEEGTLQCRWVQACLI